MHSKTGTAVFFKNNFVKELENKELLSRHNIKSKCDKRIYRANVYFCIV